MAQKKTVWSGDTSSRACLRHESFVCQNTKQAAVMSGDVQIFCLPPLRSQQSKWTLWLTAKFQGSPLSYCVIAVPTEGYFQLVMSRGKSIDSLVLRVVSLHNQP